MALPSFTIFSVSLEERLALWRDRAQKASFCRVAISLASLLVITPSSTATTPVQASRKANGPLLASPLPDTKRITYPAKRLPVLTLPNGVTQTVKSLLNVGHVMAFGEYVWDDAGVQPGPVLIRVDLSRQLVSVFRSGHEIGTALVLYGTDSNPTPSGVLTIRGKVEHYRSHKYGVPMEYTLWLNTSGIAIHASDMGPGLATRGCIGVPIDFARHLFAATHVGDKVGILSAENHT